jgi:hypothetical protein
MSSWYSQYNGKSVGRILHAINMYCGLQIAEEVQVGDGKVSLHGLPLAEYIWEGGDIPVFNFDVCCVRKDMIEEFKLNQFFFQPFINNDIFVDYVKYIVQEIRKSLTFEEALKIKFFKDENRDYHGNTLWIELKKKVVPIIKENTPSLFLSEDKYKIDIEDIWKHLCFCAIYEIL